MHACRMLVLPESAPLSHVTLAHSVLCGVMAAQGWPTEPAPAPAQPALAAMSATGGTLNGVPLATRPTSALPGPSSSSSAAVRPAAPKAMPVAAAERNTQVRPACWRGCERGVGWGAIHCQSFVLFLD